MTDDSRGALGSEPAGPDPSAPRASTDAHSSGQQINFHPGLNPQQAPWQSRAHFPPSPLPSPLSPPVWSGPTPWGSAMPANDLASPGDQLFTRRQARRMFTWALLFAGVCGLLGGLSGFASGFWAAERLTTDDTLGVPVPGELGKQVQRPADSVAGVASRSLPSVVSVSARGSRGESTGTGFVIRSDGYVLTNKHVIRAAEGEGVVLVQFVNADDPVRAKIVGSSVRYDLAVLQVDKRNLPELVLGSSLDVAVGDPVMAVGSPLGLAGTVTTGVISAMNRPVTASGSQGDTDNAYIDALQTDAAINPGNSGGPLLDGAGKVVGVNSAIASMPSALGGPSGSIGLGFAITIDQAKRTAEQIIATGRATFPIIGVALEPSIDLVGARIGSLPIDGNDPVAAGGPAATAGLKPGDIITHFDEKRVQSSTELIVMISAKSPGDEVDVAYRRGSAQHQTTVVLGEGEERP